MKMTEEQAITQIILAAESLGWKVAIPNHETDKPVSDEDAVIGMIIGREDYVNAILDGNHIETDA